MWRGQGLAVLCVLTACSIGPAPGIEGAAGGRSDGGRGRDAGDDGSLPMTGGTGGMGGATGGDGGSGGMDDDGGSEEGVPDGGGGTGGADTGVPDASSDDPDLCPGRTVQLAGSPLKAVFEEDSASFAADEMPPAACTSTSGKEAVYRVRAPQNGTLRATMDTASSGATFAPQLYVRSPTCDSAIVLACDTRPSYLSNAVVTVPVVAGTDYFFFADQAFGSMDAMFTLTFEYL